MPDITMCWDIECPKRRICYRNECSGTKPAPKRQSYFTNSPRNLDNNECDHYWPLAENDEDVDAREH